MKKNIFALLAVCLLSSGCQERKEDNVIKIGAILPLTGYAAYSGQLCAKGLEFAMDSLNSEQSQYKYKLIIEDSKSMVPDAISAYRRLEASGIKHYIVFGGQFAMGIAPMTMNKDIISFALATPNQDILKKTNRIFRLATTGESVIKALSNFTYNQKGYETTSIIYMQNDALLLYNKLYNDYYSELGGHVLSSEGCDTDTRDFKDIITKVSVHSPECVLIAALGENAGRIAKQISSNPKLKTTPIVGDMNLANPQVKSSLAEIQNEVYYADVSISDSFNDAFFEYYNESPNSFSALAFSAIEVIRRAHEEVGKDINKQLDYLKTHDFSTAVGTISFESDGEINLPVVVYSY